MDITKIALFDLRNDYYDSKADAMLCDVVLLHPNLLSEEEDKKYTNRSRINKEIMEKIALEMERRGEEL